MNASRQQTRTRVTRWRATSWIAACVGGLWLCASTQVSAASDDPFAYDLRLALAPLAFQAGVSQSWFGSALRAEYAPMHLFDVALDGRVAWFNATQADEGYSYQVRAGLAFHLAQSVQEQLLYGTVYPADTAAIGTGTPADQDLSLPVSERMRSGTLSPQDVDKTLRGLMRTTHSLRIGAAYARLIERGRPDLELRTRNQLPMLHLGYAYATHWNLAPDVSGRREIGYRRFYGDILLTTASITHAEPDQASDGTRVTFQALGARIGMQGALGGHSASAPSLGLAYDAEIGLYPGRGGLEGFLFVALGLALDFATGSASALSGSDR